MNGARAAIRDGLVVALDPTLVDELLVAYEEAKSTFYLGGLRLSAVEGGRFCEVAFRILQQQSWGTFDPLGRQLDTDRLIRDLANLPDGSMPDSVRLHIPRSMRVVYDIRNKRDAAHLGDGIDPNVQDATLVIGVLDWTLAEFVRLHHNVSPEEAQRLVEDLVTRRAPIIQDFDGFLKVLRPLKASPHCLVLLYQRGADGATYDELNEWARPGMRANLRRTLEGLANDRAFVHHSGDRYFITQAGQREVESNAWLAPD